MKWHNGLEIWHITQIGNSFNESVYVRVRLYDTKWEGDIIYMTNIENDEFMKESDTCPVAPADQCLKGRLTSGNKE